MPADSTLSDAPHRRGTVVIDRILDATLSLLATSGYAFSVEDVAQAAGVHKTTIYRHWKTKPVLVGAAIERLAAIEVPIPKSASPLDDLRALALLVAKSLRSPVGAQAIRATVAASAEDPEITEVAHRFFAGRYEAAREILGRGVAQGSIRSDVDPILVWQAIVNPMHLRAILGDPASDEVTEQLVALALVGALARVEP